MTTNSPEYIREYMRTYYRENREYAKNKNAKQAARRAIFLASLKDVPCFDCGEKYPPYVMDFDHRDPNEKRFNIGTAGNRSEATILSEAEKCDIVCANCHRERTHGRGQRKPLKSAKSQDIAPPYLQREQSQAAMLT